MKAYHITHWDSVYETAATRQVRVLSYFSKPNKLVGEGLGHMLNQTDGLELYGTWTFLEILASTAPQGQRGWLVRNGSPMDATRMSALTRIHADKIQRALDFFSTAPMDWLEFLEWEDAKQGELLPKNGTPSDGQQRADGTPSDGQQPTIDAPMAKPQRGKTDKRKTEERRERENKVAAPSSIEASKLQWATLTKQIKNLEALGSSLTVPQRQELRKKRARLAEIERRQADADFTPVQTSGGCAA